MNSRSLRLNWNRGVSLPLSCPWDTSPINMGRLSHPSPQLGYEFVLRLHIPWPLRARRQRRVGRGNEKESTNQVFSRNLLADSFLDALEQVALHPFPCLGFSRSRKVYSWEVMRNELLKMVRDLLNVLWR